MVRKHKKNCNANLFPEGGGMDFSQLASMFGQNNGQGFNFMNFANSSGMKDAQMQTQGLNAMVNDYKYSSGNSILSGHQAQQKGDLAGIGNMVDSTLQIADMIDKLNASKDNRTLAEKAGIYAYGGNIFDIGGGMSGGGVSMDSIAGAVGTAGNLAQNFIAQSTVQGTDDLKSQIRHNTVGEYNQGMTFDDVANQYTNLRTMKHISASDLRPNSWFSDVINGVSAGNQGAQSGYNIGKGVGAAIGGIAGTASSIVGSLLGRSKARKEAREANELIDEINAYNDRSLANQTSNVRQEQLGNMLGNLRAFGGSFDTVGANFDTGLSEILNGGTHEQNPNGGVQVGVDPEGKPNLVEEGEVIWKDKDYVFSKRLKVSRKMLEDNLLPTSLAGKSFAEVAKALSKESEERPVDSISKNSRDAFFERLMNAQESLKEKKANREASKQYNAMSPEEQTTAMINQTQGEEAQAQEEQLAQEQAMAQGIPQAPQGMFAEGGFMGNIFANGGDKTQLIQDSLPKQFMDSASAFIHNKWLEQNTDKIPYYSDGKYDSGYLNYINNLSQADFDAMYNAQSKEWKAKHAKPTLQKARAWAQDGKGGAFTDMLAKGYDSARLNAFTPFKDIAITGKAPLVPSITPDVSAKSQVAPTLTKEEMFPQTVPFTPDKRQIADYMRASSIIPGLYGLNNPPQAGYMAPTRSRDVAFNPSAVEYNARPWDFNFIANQLMANSRGAERSILNTAGNRGQAMAGVLANNYNLINSLGKAYAQGMEYNQGLEDKRANFYNQRDLSNAQGMLQAGSHNSANDAAYDQRFMSAQQYNQSERDKVYATKMANLENLFGNLSNIGEDILNREDAKDTAKAQRESITNKKSCGGRIRKRRGFTC